MLFENNVQIFCGQTQDMGVHRFNAHKYWEKIYISIDKAGGIGYTF